MLGQLIASGLATGSLYALTAVAVVVVFRNTRTINLAQGDFAMMGAFWRWFSLAATRSTTLWRGLTAARS